MSERLFERPLNQRRYRKRNEKLVDAYVASHPCVDCGESDIRVLEFDHVRSTKRGDVSLMVGRGSPWGRIETEIAKCDVRCANCHRRKTVEQLRWRKAFGA